MRPFSVGLFQERRFWGGAGSVAGAVAYVQQPGTIFGSAVGDYYDFDLRTEKHVDQEAIAFEIASRQHERIEHLMDLEQLLAFTRSSVWTIDGGVDSPLAWNRVMIRRIDRVGCGDVAPLEVDGCPLFIRKKGFGARALVPLGQGAGYRGADISQHAEHLFTGPAKNVVDWTYQEDPWGLVWAVRADGKLLSLQFSHEHSAAAWTPHEMKYFDESGTLFDEAFVEAICCVPEGDEDAVYMVVRRSFDGPHGLAVRNIERMTSRVRRVTAEDDDPEYVSAPTAADTDTLYPTDVCLDCAVPYAGPPTFLIPNLDPVVGEYVYVVARGLPLIGPIALETDELDLEPYLDDLPATNAVDEHGVPIFVCHVGLAFTADLETLDITADRLGRKTIERLGFEVDNSIGVQAGQDFDHLDDFQVRTVEDGYEPVAPGTQLIETPVRSVLGQQRARRASAEQTGAHDGGGHHERARPWRLSSSSPPRASSTPSRSLRTCARPTSPSCAPAALSHSRACSTRCRSASARTRCSSTTRSRACSGSSTSSSARPRWAGATSGGSGCSRPTHSPRGRCRWPAWRAASSSSCSSTTRC
jgi:hypothetical protein